MNCNEQCFGCHGLYDVDDDIANSRRMELNGNDFLIIGGYESGMDATRKEEDGTYVLQAKLVEKKQELKEQEKEGNGQEVEEEEERGEMGQFRTPLQTAEDIIPNLDSDGKFFSSL